MFYVYFGFYGFVLGVPKMSFSQNALRFYFKVNKEEAGSASS
jgi:predicted PurR-regulated permease PerM